LSQAGDEIANGLMSPERFGMTDRLNKLWLPRFGHEMLPHVPDAWIDESATKISYEISFTRYFYKPQPLRTLEEIRADILALEQETEGLLQQILLEG
jgi:hypothetical protein